MHGSVVLPIPFYHCPSFSCKSPLFHRSREREGSFFENSCLVFFSVVPFSWLKKPSLQDLASILLMQESPVPSIWEKGGVIFENSFLVFSRILLPFSSCKSPPFHQSGGREGWRAQTADIASNYSSPSLQATCEDKGKYKYKHIRI